jgi:3',5'-cyclic AMP phosphodiesterase CpdA
MPKTSLAILSLFLAGHSLQAAETFLEKPYLQLGNAPKLATSESLMLLWHTENTPADWSVEVKTAKDAKWRAMAKPGSTVVSAPAGTPAVAGKNGEKKDAPASAPIAPHLVYRAQLTGLLPGGEFQYRVLKSAKPVFEAASRARKSAKQAQRFVLFGDCGQKTAASNAIAYQAYLAKPDFLFIPGDIVYTFGRIAEYRDHFFPQYNADEPSAASGAPLLRSIPFIAAPGNHDTALRNFQRFPDALAYFHYWDQPLNGPDLPVAAGATHVLNGSAEAQPEFLEMAKPRYPRMANYSFDYGNAHWTVLDSNPYMDWNNPALRDWLRKDLAAARSATWRFVAFHHPGFNASHHHFAEQYMRILSPMFEANKVDVVFAGHVHNYQRSFPLTFVAKPQADGKMISAKGEVDGDWKLDKSFGDGSAAKPKGVIYIVSGAGGAGLYDPEQQADPKSWQPFTDKFFSEVNSMTVVDINGKEFKMRQVSSTGKELDSFRIKK